MHSYIHCRIIYNSSDNPMVRQTDKFMCIDRGILLSHKKDKILLFTTWLVLEVTEPGLIQYKFFHLWDIKGKNK